MDYIRLVCQMKMAGAIKQQLVDLFMFSNFLSSVWGTSWASIPRFYYIYAHPFY